MWEEPGSAAAGGQRKGTRQPPVMAVGPADPACRWTHDVGGARQPAAGGQRKGIRQPPVTAVSPADPACRWTRDVGGRRQRSRWGAAERHLAATRYGCRPSRPAGGQRKGIRQSPVTAVGPADPLEGGGKTSGRLGEVTERLCYRGIPLRLSAQPTRLRMASHRVSAIQSREGKG